MVFSSIKHPHALSESATPAIFPTRGFDSFQRVATVLLTSWCPPKCSRRLQTLPDLTMGNF